MVPESTFEQAKCCRRRERDVGIGDGVRSELSRQPLLQGKRTRSDLSQGEQAEWRTNRESGAPNGIGGHWYRKMQD
jgi:hypothetical protein